MTKYEMIYESLQSQLEQGLITMELAEEVNDMAYDKYVVEDKSDIARNYSEERMMQKVRSMAHVSKRPKIGKNMSDAAKKDLYDYDHGNALIGGDVISRRGSSTQPQSAKLKATIDKNNKMVKKNYDKLDKKYAKERLKKQKITKKDPDYFKDGKDVEKQERKQEKKDAIKNNIKTGLRQTKNAFIPHKSSL